MRLYSYGALASELPRLSRQWRLGDLVATSAVKKCYLEPCSALIDIFATMFLQDAAHLAFGHPVLLLSVVLLSYTISTCIYQWLFHPLAQIPGPFLPAVTKLYQSYYNRRYYLQIEKLHAQYGPIVRITPDEVHIADTEHNAEYYEKSMRCLIVSPSALQC